ncbi:hypothetical protein PR003_g20661 [Phytophthora rubi]|uniref:Uncharacterized protein n=1 Tax=Phytophthora rubi TaxID=129364 RepID=A0A6A4DNT9_9STRA|nr:hypothetical protein PR003_g20661 [Phytophthora rubi]
MSIIEIIKSCSKDGFKERYPTYLIVVRQADQIMGIKEEVVKKLIPVTRST